MKLWPAWADEEGLEGADDDENLPAWSSGEWEGVATSEGAINTRPRPWNRPLAEPDCRIRLLEGYRERPCEPVWQVMMVAVVMML